MDNNAKTATPVNLEGIGPGMPPLDVNATIVAPLPLPVRIYPLPVYSVDGQEFSGGTLIVQQQVCAEPCKLIVIAGMNADPTAGNLLFVQLHNVIGVIPPGRVPEVVVAVYGGYTPYSFGVGLVFDTGLAIGLSSTLGTFTASATPYLTFSSTFLTA
jgi:hypothetical protein